MDDRTQHQPWNSIRAQIWTNSFAFSLFHLFHEYFYMFVFFCPGFAFKWIDMMHGLRSCNFPQHKYKNIKIYDSIETREKKRDLFPMIVALFFFVVVVVVLQFHFQLSYDDCPVFFVCVVQRNNYECQWRSFIQSISIGIQNIDKPTLYYIFYILFCVAAIRSFTFEFFL